MTTLPKNGRRDSVGHLELAPLVGLRELQVRAEHSSQHGVWMRHKEGGIDYEPGVIHHKGDPVVANVGGGVGGGARGLVLGGWQHVAASGKCGLDSVETGRQLLPIARSIVTLLRRSYRVAPGVR